MTLTGVPISSPLSMLPQVGLFRNLPNFNVPLRVLYLQAIALTFFFKLFQPGSSPKTSCANRHNAFQLHHFIAICCYSSLRICRPHGMQRCLHERSRPSLNPSRRWNLLSILYWRQDRHSQRTNYCWSLDIQGCRNPCWFHHQYQRQERSLGKPHAALGNSTRAS
jgi:hypothetical protein